MSAITRLGAARRYPPPSTERRAKFCAPKGLPLFAAAAGAYAHYGFGWGLFAALFLAPDLTFLAYLGGPKVGAAAYNALHTTIFPLALTALGFAQAGPRSPSD